MAVDGAAELVVALDRDPIGLAPSGATSSSVAHAVACPALGSNSRT